jgi:hypothetical protein
MPDLTALDQAQEDDRLNPLVLTTDARSLVANAADPVALVASLLKTIRQNRDTEEAIERGYSAAYRTLEARHNEVCHERNEYREALRVIKRAARNVRFPRD